MNSRSGRAGETAVNHNDFAGDKPVGLQQVQHGLGHVVSRHAAFERCGPGAFAHQILIFVAQHALHPVALHPARRHSVDTNFWPQIPGQGFGHVDNKLVEKQTINGLNVEVNPATIVGGFMAFMYVMYLPEILSKKRKITVADTLHNAKKPDFIIPYWDKTPYLKLNGINISSGCFFTNTSMNGLNISFGNKFKNFNGLSITPLGTMADKQNGISVGLINANNDLNGFVVGAYNQSFKLDGLQIGLVNQTMTNHGLQIGVFNRSYTRGFQIGIWNKNENRSFPIINW